MVFNPLRWLVCNDFRSFWWILLVLLDFICVFFYHSLCIRCWVLNRAFLFRARLEWTAFSRAWFQWTTTFAWASLCRIFRESWLRLRRSLIDKLGVRYAWGHWSSAVYAHLVVDTFSWTGSASLLLSCHLLFSRGNLTHKFRVLAIRRLVIGSRPGWWLASTLGIVD